MPANTPPRELPAMGYTNVGHYPEDKQGWMEARLPVEEGARSLLFALKMSCDYIWRGWVFWVSA